MTTSADLTYLQNETPTKAPTEESITRGSVKEEPKQTFGGADVELESPVTEKTPQQKWNSPRVNIYRVLGANFSFIIMGMNDAAYGVCTPPLLQ